MRPGDEILIVLAGEAVMLRPSLRHAIRLERRPGSFRALIDELADGSLSAACEIIAAHHPHPFLQTRVFEAGLDTLAEPLTDYVLACVGISREAEPSPEDGRSTERLPFADYLQRLFEIGTGWLGWMPAATLEATPAEIVAAFKGQREMMKAIFGGNDEEPQQPDKRGLGEKFRAVFASFGTKIDRQEASLGE